MFYLENDEWSYQHRINYFLVSDLIKTRVSPIGVCETSQTVH